MLNLDSIIGRIAERKIQEAIEEGQFENLPGQGKPLVFEDDPFTPPHLRLANKILKNAGVLPEWIQVQKDIQTEQQEIAALRARLLRDNVKWRSKVAALPEADSTLKAYAEWHAKSRASYLRHLKSVNTFILKFSLLAPSSSVAPAPYKIEAEMEAFDTEFLPPAKPVSAAPQPEPEAIRSGLKGIARARYQVCADDDLPQQMTLLPFDLRYPIWQAPTGSIAGPELAAAVSQAGAMGAMAATWTAPETAAAQVRQVRARTDRPFLVNFALAFPPTALSAALEAGAPCITFSWGDPTPYLPQVRASGAKVGIQVTNVEGARRMVQAGADFLICQGVEAGGHVQSTQPLWELLPRIIEAAEGVPVVAAGGIGDGAGIAKALSLGAAGAMLGTRFVATQESRAHPDYKRRLIAANADDTALTICFEGGWPYAAHRVLRNPTLENWEAAGSPPVGRRPGENEVVARTANGEPIYRYEDTAPRQGFTGDIIEMCLYAGTSCTAIHDIPPAAALVERLWAEAKEDEVMG